MRVGVIGRTHLLYNAVVPLREAGHEIACIITCREGPEYRRTAADFENLARELSVPFLVTEWVNRPEAITWVGECRPDIGVSINWRTVIDGEFRSLFPHGIINVHFGDLPRYRGNATPNWAILNGESRAVLTLHLMSDQLDAGPILLQEEVSINDDTCIGDIYDAADKLIPPLLVKAVDGLQNGTLAAQPQSEDQRLALRCYPRLPRDGEIDWRLAAAQIGRLVRASAEPFAGAYTYTGTGKLTVWRARPEKAAISFLGVPGQVAEVRKAQGEVAVVTGEDFLILEQVEFQGTGRRAASEIINSIRTRLGMDVTGEIHRLNLRLEELLNRDK